ncbi:MAG: hypothetical protein EOL97_13585, partial [Spirochaetia bacterium]|nr:hypothetical protein [Spirochaetia bacterium]
MIKGKTKYKLYDELNNEYNLYAVSDFSRGGDSTIVVYESATGNQGYSFWNGRTQESITLNGTLIYDTNQELMNAIEKIEKLRINGDVVEFINPFKSAIRSNKYFISSFSTTFNKGTDTIASFTMTITEKRDVNVKKIAVNLVNYNTSITMLETY